MSADRIPRAVGTGAQSQSTFSYDDLNRVVTTTGDLTANNDNVLLGKVLYDGLGRTTETRQYEGGTNYISAQTQYDALGRAYRVSNPFRPWQSETAVWTTTAFDALGRVTSVTTPDSAVVTSSYNGNAETATDQAGKSRKSVADALGRLTSVYEDPNGLNYQTNYGYDVLDDLVTVNQGVQARSLAYDSMKRLISVTNPESGTTSYAYDNNGNLLTRTDARGIVTTIAYDALNRPTGKSYSDGTPNIAYFYDSQTLPGGAPSFDRGCSIGALVAVTYGGGGAGTYRGYDAMGRVIRQYQQTDSVNYLVEASYSPGFVTSETYPSVPGAGDRRTITFTPDSAGRLASLNSNAPTYAPGASVSSIGYASSNALNTETYGNSVVHSVTYNNRLQPTEIRLGTSGNPTSIIDLTYNSGTTNNNGNVLSAGYVGGGLSYTQSFGYDALNRLTTSNENGGSSWSQTNGYDQYGNRWIDYGGGVHNLAFSTSNNRITTTGFSYDAAGNLTNDTLHAYAFDAENKIKTVDAVTAYTYDGEGHRVRKFVGENTRFVYGIAGQLVAEFDGDTGNLRKEYLDGGATLIAIEPTAVNSNGAQYTTPDNLGSPRVITNSSGGVVSRHDYQPYGEELGTGIGGRTTAMGFSNSGDNNRKKFTGYERDTESGLDFAQARYYANTEGRFTSADIFGGRLTNPQTLNRYAYVLNNPLKLIDPTGHQDQNPDTKAKVDPDSVKRSERAMAEVLDKPKVTLTIRELGMVNNSATNSNFSSALFGPSGTTPSIVPRPRTLPSFDITPRTHQSSLPHIFPRKIGWTEGVTGIIAYGNNVMGGTLSGFFMHDFVDETTILGETHGGKFASMDDSAGGGIATAGLGGGLIFSNADDKEINGSAETHILSIGPLGVESDTGQNASKEFILYPQHHVRKINGRRSCPAANPDEYNVPAGVPRPAPSRLPEGSLDQVRT